MTAPATPPPDDKDWTVVISKGCAQCGFDADVDPRAAGGRLRADAKRWQAALARPDVSERPSPLVWSPLEYGCHVRDVLRIFAGRLELMLAEDGARFANWDQDAAAVEGRYWEQDPAIVSAELVEFARELAVAFDGVPEDSWGNRGLRSNGAEFTVATFAVYLLHDVEHHLHDVNR